MKKANVYTLISIIMLFAVLFSACGHTASEQPKTMNELFEGIYGTVRLSGMADYAQFDYPGLMDRAHTVALVTPLDELTAENSFGVSESGDKFYNIHSIRQVKVLKYFKNENSFGDTMELAEKCVLLPDGTLVHEEACYPMQKGDTYLVFLINSGYGKPLAISADNGKFDLSNLRLNNRLPLVAQALTDLGLAQKSEVSEAFADAQAVSWSGEESYSQFKNISDWNTAVFTTEYTKKGFELPLEYTNKNGEYAFRLGEYIYK